MSDGHAYLAYRWPYMWYFVSFEVFSGFGLKFPAEDYYNNQAYLGLDLKPSS